MLSRISNTLVGVYGYITKILEKKLNVFIIIYLDNIYVYTKNKNLFLINAI